MLKTLPYARLAIAAWCVSFFGMPGASAVEPLSIADAIQTSRPLILNFQDDIAAVSPDGQRYAFGIVRGELQRDGLRFEIFTGRFRSIGTAPHSVANLFTSGLGGGQTRSGDLSELTLSGMNPLTWSDDAHVVFLWEDARATRQLMSLNVDTGTMSCLTRFPADVTDFKVGTSGTILLRVRQHLRWILQVMTAALQIGNDVQLNGSAQISQPAERLPCPDRRRSSPC